MEVVIKNSAREVSRFAALLVAQVIRRKPDAVLGLPTGATPLPMYRELIRMHREEHLDFFNVRTFNLDEYIGLGADHPGSYHRFMRKNFFDHINLPAKQIHIPDGLAKDVQRVCEEYEARIRAVGGIDLQVLGLGSDGHIGFNEPSSSLASRTRIKTLTQKTISANARFFGPGEQIPRHVITMGVGTIMDARRCLLLASGEVKAPAVARMVEGPVTALVPASALQFHPSTTIIIDAAAAKDLLLADYYRFVYENKPPWQNDA